MANQYTLQTSRALIQAPYTTTRPENPASEYYGRVRMSFFSFVTEAAAPTSGGTNSDSTQLPIGATVTDGGYGPLNSGDTLLLCKVPKGAKVLDGILNVGAMGTSATASIGTATLDDQGNITVVDATHYLSAGDVSAAAKLTFADTLARNYGENLTVNTWLILTAGGANFANQKAIAGHILWTLD